MASPLLLAHSGIRWLVLLFAIYAIGRMVAGQTRHGTWAKPDAIASRMFLGTLDLQFLLGILLYAISPLTQGAMNDFGAAMKDPNVRFFVVEHPVFMVIAMISAHGGAVWSRKAASDADKFKRAGLGFAFGLGMILAGIPWFRLGVS